MKIIDKTVPTHSRSRVFKEIDLFHHCQVYNVYTCSKMYFKIKKPVTKRFERRRQKEKRDIIMSMTDI